MTMTQTRTLFKRGMLVTTPWGDGKVVGFDLPLSRARRIIVKITRPTRELPEWGPNLCFLPTEIERKVTSVKD